MSRNYNFDEDEQMIKFKPLHDNIVVRRVEAEKMTESGLHIPDVISDREKPQEGVVLAIGEGRRYDGVLVGLALGVGDKVMFGKYAGQDIVVEDEELLIMTESDVYGVMP